MTNLPLGVVLSTLVFSALSTTFVASRTDRISLFFDRDRTQSYAASRSTNSRLARGGGSGIIINEVDSDTPGTDTAEFVELYDGGAGNTPLDGLVIVFYNGGNDASYASFDLDGFVTNGNGYFTLGNAAVPGVDLIFANNSLQNGQDAVALYSGNATDFPNGTPVTIANVLDAIVYDNGQADDAALLVLLNASQPQINENGSSSGQTVSMQRCPNGSGGSRNTSTYAVFAPTPDGSNICGTVQPDIIALSSAAFTEDESQTMVIGLTRTGAGTATSSVRLTTSGGTATPGTCSAGADYESQNIVVTIGGGETSATVNVPICADQFNEIPETFSITLSEATNATIGSPSMAIGNINEAATQFRNTEPIIVNESGAASPFPSSISVTGGPNSISYVRVTLFDLAVDAADDIDILLVGPGGHSFVLMADSGGAGPIPSGTTLTFDDSTASLLPDSTAIASASYKPTSWEDIASVFPLPAPVGPHAEPGPGGSPVPRSAQMNSVFGGTNANGTWSLYVLDDTAGPIAMAPGTVAAGWGIEILAPTAAPVSLSGRVTDANGNGIPGAILVLDGTGMQHRRIALSSPFGYYSFPGLPIGTYVVTVFSKRFTFPVSSRTFTLSENVSDADFLAAPLE